MTDTTDHASFHAIVVHPPVLWGGGFYCLEARITPKGMQSFTDETLAKLRRATGKPLEFEETHDGHEPHGIITGYYFDAYRFGRLVFEAEEFARTLDSFGLSAGITSGRLELPFADRALIQREH